MRFAKHLISDERISNVSQIKKMLEESTAIPGIFCICLSVGSANTLEIVSCTQLIKAPFMDYTVIGFADGRKQAFALVRKIYQDCLDNGGDIFALKKNMLRSALEV